MRLKVGILKPTEDYKPLRISIETPKFGGASICHVGFIITKTRVLIAHSGAY